MDEAADARETATRRTVLRAVGRWGLGLLGALLVCRAVAPLCTNSIEPVIVPPELGVPVRVPGTVHRHRTEGHASSHFGRFGVPGVPDIRTLPGPVIAIWGDSHVEGLVVPDPDKIAAQVAAGLARGEGPARSAFGVGRGGAGIASAAFLMPRYERIRPGILRHYVVVARPDYVRPGGADGGWFHLDPGPPPALVDRSATRPAPRNQRVMRVLHDTGFEFVLRAYQRLRKKSFRFGLGQQATRPTTSPAPVDPGPAWERLCAHLAREPTAPVTLVYAPLTPSIRNGKIEYTDDFAAGRDRLAAACRANGIGFLDVTDRLHAFVRRTGRFPRGFANSPPASGHFNADGMRLVAEAILDDLGAR